jgi:hypothetical protein
VLVVLALSACGGAEFSAGSAPDTGPRPSGDLCNGLMDQCDGNGNCVDCVNNGGCSECCVCQLNKCVAASFGK